MATPTYSLDGWQGNVRDDDGTEWVVESEEGWSSTPGLRLSLEELPDQDGSYDGPSYRGPRTITLGGHAYAASRAAMLRAKDQLAGLCDDQGIDALQPLVVTEAHLTRQAMVRLAADTKISDEGARLFAWSLALIAPDPLRYDAAERTDATGLPLDYPGRVYPRSHPWSYPAHPANTAGELVLDNAGTATTWPVLTVTGPVSGPRLIHAATGQELALDIDLAITDTLELDTASRSVVLNGTASRRYTLRAGSEWWGLTKGVNTVLYRADAYAANSRLQVRWRSAWR